MKPSVEQQSSKLLKKNFGAIKDCPGTCVKIPKNSSDFSVNWKTICVIAREKRKGGPELVQATSSSDLQNEQKLGSSKTHKRKLRTNQEDHQHDSKPITTGSASSSEKLRLPPKKRILNATIKAENVAIETIDGSKFTAKQLKMALEKQLRLNSTTNLIRKDNHFNATVNSTNENNINKFRNLKPGATLNSDQLKTQTKNNQEQGLTKCVAIDCEFVGVGPNGQDDMLARVSLVNLYGHCIYDKHVAPMEEIVDYRTHVSGIRPEDLENAAPLKIVQKEVGDIINSRILIGHGVKKDLQVLFVSHPKKDIRDTSKFREFHRIAKTTRPSLKKLAKLVLGLDIQTGEHDSVTDARVAMQLYKTQRKEWENKKFKFNTKRKANDALPRPNNIQN